MKIGIAVLGVACFLVCGPASAQARGEPVLDAAGTPQGLWKAKRVCVAPDRCGIAVTNSQTGEVAMYDGKITQGFDLVGEKGIARGSATVPTHRSLPPLGYDNVRTPSGQLVAPWTEENKCLETKDKKAECYKFIHNPKTHEIAVLNDKLTPGFAATGNGQEITRLKR